MNTYLRALPSLAAIALFAAGMANQSRSPAPEGSARVSKKQMAQSEAANLASSKRKIPCKTPQNASLCYRTYGRLEVANGNPTLRIWRIGTHRVLAVYSGPSHYPPRTIADDENPELPQELYRAYKANNRAQMKATGMMWALPPYAYADFEVCPLVPEHKGWMQPICIECAKNIYVEKDY